MYYGKNYGTLPNSIELKLTKEKNDRLPKTKTLWFIIEKKNYPNIPKQLKFLNKFIALELWFTLENYGTMEKTIVLWKKLWYYCKL